MTLSSCHPDRKHYGKGLCEKCFYRNRYNTERKNDSAFKLRTRNTRLKREYGITQEQYLAMYNDQDGKCLICDRQKEKLHIDHCHKTGIVRGLLCYVCNTYLGYVERDFSILSKITWYLIVYGKYDTKENKK